MADMIKRWTKGIIRRVGFPISILFILTIIPQTTVLAQVPQIISTSPAQNALNVPISTNISVTFDIDMDEGTINDSTFVVNARSTGLHQGTITYDSLTRMATLDPDSNFHVGEVVTVVLTTNIQSSQGVPLDSSYIWSFTMVVNDGSGTFGPDAVYPVSGEYAHSIFAADLDGDDDIDLATANWNSGDASVLLNNGDGTFTLDSVYVVGDGASRNAAADLDGDGDIDLATANHDPDNVAVLLNNGDGTFASASHYPAGGNPWSIFAADLDGDGDIDLAIENGWYGHLSVLLNNGDATFGPYVIYPVGGFPCSVFPADLDGDGDLDLSTAKYWGEAIAVLMNNGDGTFASAVAYPVGDHPFSVFAADLNGDGDLDVACTNRRDNNVSVLLNNGDGTFGPHEVYAVGADPFQIFSADLDGDGDLDLITANADSDDLSVLLNNGDGTFASHSVYPVGDMPFSVFAADLDGDGDLDLAVSNELSNNVSVLLNLSSHDVAVTNVTLSDSCVGQGDSMFIDVTVENQGNCPETFSVTTSYYDGIIGSIPNGDFEEDTTGTSFNDISDWNDTSYIWYCVGDCNYDENLEIVDDYYFHGNKSLYSYLKSNVGVAHHVNVIQWFWTENPLNTTSDYISLWISGDGYTTSSRYFWYIGLILTDGTNTYEEILRCDCWGNNEGCTPNHFDYYDATETGADGRTWKRYTRKIPDGIDKSNLTIKFEHEQGSWDGTKASSWYRLDNIYFSDSLGNPCGLIETKSIINLPPGEDTTLTFIWNPRGVAPGDYTISAYAHPLPGETDTTDNTYVDGIVRIVQCGDINGDDKINLGDVIYLANYLLKGGPTPVSEWASDVNCDNLLNLADVIKLANYLIKGGEVNCCE